MPMPKPEEDQSHDDFMKMCMGDEVMKEDYADEKQRYAVCQGQWDEEHEEDGRSAIGGNTGRGIMPFEFDLLEVRANESEQKMIRGHGAVYSRLSLDLGGFREMFLPGAFTESIKQDDIRSLRDHNPTYILGRRQAGTLTLSEDDKGVYYEVIPPDTSYARDLMVSIERKDVTGGSIFFRVDGKKNERWLVDGNETPMIDAFMAMFEGKKHKIERHILKSRLLDIGPVTFPAYPQTDVAVRSLMEAAKEKIEISARDRLDVESALNGRALSLARSRFRFRH